MPGPRRLLRGGPRVARAILGWRDRSRRRGRELRRHGADHGAPLHATRPSSRWARPSRWARRGKVMHRTSAGMLLALTLTGTSGCKADRDGQSFPGGNFGESMMIEAAP